LITPGSDRALGHIAGHWKANGIDPFQKWGGDRQWSTDRNANGMKPSLTKVCSAARKISQWTEW
jgi:hypothetical protein